MTTFNRISTDGKWWPVSELGTWLVAWGCPRCGQHRFERDVPDDGRKHVKCPCGWENENAHFAGWNQHGGEVHDH